VTPAIDVARAAGIMYKLHSYAHDPSSQSFGLEAAEKLGVLPERVFKTLLVESNRDMCMGLVPVSAQLNLKYMAKVFGKKKVAMADPKRVEKVTGYVVGGVSPLGQKRSLIAFMDESAILFETIFVSAGKRGLDVEVRATDLLVLLDAKLTNLI
jgi:Cys-tRNA(Pro)/Cys-tRNA(Cys) deacylase